MPDTTKAATAAEGEMDRLPPAVAWGGLAVMLLAGYWAGYKLNLDPGELPIW